MPAVVLLHGCGQTPAEFADATRFVDAADRSGFVLVLPHQEGRHHPQRCWRWYEVAHQHRGAGEPAVLAGMIGQVVAEQSRWRVDPRRVYAAGLSAGGAMALTLAAVYPDLVAAVGVHSAPAYRSATRPALAFAAMGARTGVPAPETGVPMAPVIVVQGTADGVVQARNGNRRDGRRPGPVPHHLRSERGRPGLDRGALVRRARAQGAGVLADRGPRARLVRRAARWLLQRSCGTARGHADVAVLPAPPAVTRRAVAPTTRPAGCRWQGSPVPQHSCSALLFTDGPMPTPSRSNRLMVMTRPGRPPG
jgi:poly(hydroxyalkanoate) depolymerase family esterase